jgi:glycosyltransferase involved in cell wall biosynthesis
MEEIIERKKIRLAIVHPAPYPVKLPLFDIVCSQTDGIVIFSTKDSIDHPNWNIDEILKQFTFKHIFLPGFRIKRVDIRPSVFWRLLRYRPEVIVTTEFNLQTIFSYLYARMFNSEIFIQSNATIKTDSSLKKRQNLRKWLIKHCDGFIANSSETKKYLCDLGVDPKNVTISIQTIDVHKWKKTIGLYNHLKERLKKELDLKEKVILCVSRMQPKKGINFLIEAFCNISNKLEDVSLLLVGDGPERQKLEKYCIEKGISGKVKFIGYIQPLDIPRYYALSDLFVFPTLYDKFGLVVIEAISSGLPVICSEHAGSAIDLIKDGENGYIIDPKDINKMSSLISEIMINESLLQKLKSTALESASNFTVEKSAENFLSAIRSNGCGIKI